MDLNIQMVVLGKSHILHGLIHAAVVHFDAGDDFRVESVQNENVCPRPFLLQAYE